MTKKCSCISCFHRRYPTCVHVLKAGPLLTTLCPIFNTSMIVILEYHRPMWALCNVFGPYASPILWWYAVQPLHCSMGNAQCWQCLSTAEIHFLSFVFVLWGKTCKIKSYHVKFIFDMLSMNIGHLNAHWNVFTWFTLIWFPLHRLFPVR